MSDTKFTPGPWEVVNHVAYPSFRVVRGPSFTVQAVMIALDLTFEDSLQRAADLNLIAAAPDMYEALESIEGKVNDLHVKDFITTDEHGMILAALAKARGESNG